MNCERCKELEEMLKGANGRELVTLSKVQQVRSERDVAMRRVEELEEQLQDARRNRG